MGIGQVEFIEDPKEKAAALNCMIRHLGKIEDTFQFPEAMLKKNCVYKVCSTDITGKHHECLFIGYIILNFCVVN